MGDESAFLVFSWITLIDSNEKSLQFLEINISWKIFEIWYLFSYDGTFYLLKNIC